MHISARRFVVMFLAGAVALPAAGAQGASQYWNTLSGNWSTALCWSGSAVPGSGDSVYIANGGTVTVAQAGATCSSLTIGGSGNCAIQLNAGSLAIGSVVYAELVGNTTPGSFIQTGGTHSAVVGLFLGNGNTSSGSGSYSLSGGSLSVPALYVGNLESGTFMQSGGTCSVSSELDVGSGSNGSFSLGGSGLLSSYQEVVGDESIASFTQSGGTNNVTNGLDLGQNLGSTGSYTLQGGLLNVSSLALGPGDGSFNFTGGTLRSGPIAIAAGSNAVLDTAGGTLAISTSISGDGSLTKSGTGLLVLSGTNSYIGGTIVSAGTLEFAGANSVLKGTNLMVGADASQKFVDSGIDAPPLDDVQSVPEPTSLSMSVFGAIAVACWLRYRLVQAPASRLSTP
jgi:fibronectin-binding autotransporter adhesin